MQYSRATRIARLDRCTSSTGPTAGADAETTALPAFAALGAADAVGRHYALLYTAYQAAQPSRSVA